MWKKKRHVVFAFFTDNLILPDVERIPIFLLVRVRFLFLAFYFYLNIYSSLPASNIPLPASLFGDVENLMASCRESLRF